MEWNDNIKLFGRVFQLNLVLCFLPAAGTSIGYLAPPKQEEAAAEVDAEVVVPSPAPA
jgi:hypothetical protein